MLKKRYSPTGDPNYKFSSLTTLMYSAEASELISGDPCTCGTILHYPPPTGAVTALMTNPIWVVKVRLFTTKQGAPQAYRGLWGTLIIPSTHAHHLIQLWPCFNYPLSVSVHYQMASLGCIARKGFMACIEEHLSRYLGYQMAQYNSWRMNS